MFIQPDWFDVMQPGVSTNRFSYAFNDPINKADQNGNQTIGSSSNSDFWSSFWAAFSGQSAGSKASSAQASETASALGWQTGQSILTSPLRMGEEVVSGYDYVQQNTVSGNILLPDRAAAMSGDPLAIAGMVPVGKLPGVASRISQISTNAANGVRREVEALMEMQAHFPNASIQGQQFLRNADGRIAKDALTKQGRRLDFVAIENGTARQVREVTSMTANKVSQMQKQDRILNSGGNYVRDRMTGQLVNVSNQGIYVMDRRP